MLTIVLAFGLMLLLVAAMAVGVLMGRKPISGSCGGMSALGMEVACDICGGDKGKCDEENATTAASVKAEDQFYDASK
ncbi:(Na+)-NQR maturation NqrM [Marinomonas sp. 15G1-11]|uniref:(Na+)-NQR maturation NqrM n=1 Tax=Marinomonas phaeophyticola TaxID=3004091 RepID=A0ABT4JX59_9GAMM|nr:(Na+)-NQR maturation NqrM [Marinomonas sp. 15G1-11]MCZ2722801.1 (Na+)-NQR maturation NqrM [Marinomonas sp. 15G1-11]